MVRFKVCHREKRSKFCIVSDEPLNQNRWLLVEFIPFTPGGVATYAASDGLTGKHIWNALKESVIVNFGDTGWGAVGSSLTGELTILVMQRCKVVLN